MADAVLCPNAATPGGFGGTATNVSGPLDGTCGPNSAVQLSIPAETDYGKLMFNSSMSGYPAGLTFGNLSSISANVAFSGQPGDQPYYLLAFTDASNSLGQASATDQILMIEFQSSTLSGNTLAVDPSATLFNLYDNNTGIYLQGGQQNKDTISGWLTSHSSLANESLQGIWLGIGLAGGGTSPETLTVNSLSVAAVPEPETYAMLLAGLGLLGFMARRRKQKESA
jgi:hypothetical protein